MTPYFLRSARLGFRHWNLEDLPLAQALWGNPDVSRCVIEHAFETLQAGALLAGHNPGNRASKDLLSRLGFAYTHDEFYAPTGLQHPSYLLVRPEPYT